MANVRRFTSRIRGLALIETALVLPVLLLLTFGLLEYGWLFLQAEQVTNAARHGARVAVRPDATTAQVQTGVQAMLTDAKLGGSNYTLTITPGDVTTPVPGELVRVEISVPYENVTLLNLGSFLPTPETLRASVSMAKEGP